MKLLSGAELMGVVAVLVLVYEWDFDRRAEAGCAVVTQNVALGGKSGLTIADVLHVVEGRQVGTTLRAWYCHPRPGQRVRILYLPSDPEDVVLDWFWQRHFGSTIAMALFTVLAATDALRSLAWRRRQAVPLLRDDYVAPRAGSRGAPTLPIDTAPRLWDQDLDG